MMSRTIFNESYEWAWLIFTESMDDHVSFSWKPQMKLTHYPRSDVSASAIFMEFMDELVFIETMNEQYHLLELKMSQTHFPGGFYCSWNTEQQWFCTK